MRFLVPGKKMCISKIVQHEAVKTPKNPRKIHLKCLKISRNEDFMRIFAKNLGKSVLSQVFLEPIQNLVSTRSAHLEAAYLEALLYSKLILHNRSHANLQCRPIAK